MLRELMGRIDVQADECGHIVELTGDIVRLISLREGQFIPDAFKSSVKVVARLDTMTKPVVKSSRPDQCGRSWRTQLISLKHKENSLRSED